MRAFLAALAATIVLSGSAQGACVPSTVAGGAVLEPGSFTLTGGSPPPSATRPAPLPEGPLEDVRIRLGRSSCFGGCASYVVELRGDGSAHYEGRLFTFVEGGYDFQVDPKVVACRVEAFRAADFWSLPGRYEGAVTHAPTLTLSLTIGGQTKTMSETAGAYAGMPRAVGRIESELDTAAAPWVIAGGMTVTQLRDAGLDFHSPSAGNMVARALADAKPDLALALLKEGAPTSGVAKAWGGQRSTLDLAMGVGRTDVIDAVLAKGGMLESADAKAAALQTAVLSGDPAVVARILAYAPDVNTRDRNGATPLMLVEDSPQRRDFVGSYEDRWTMRSQLVAAGADLTQKDSFGRSALFRARDSNSVRQLVALGAPLEDRDANGQTPLLAAADETVALELIRLGADKRATSSDGASVADKARWFGWKRVLLTLEPAPGP